MSEQKPDWRCDNCGEEGCVNDLDDIDHERVQAGEELPLGSCPGCGFHVYVEAVIEPKGDLGREELKITGLRGEIITRKQAHMAEQVGARVDWYNDRMQILIDDTSEDQALHIRFNPDGSIAEILVRDDLMGLVKIEGESNSPWQDERDNRKEATS